MKIGTEILFWVEDILTQKITLKKGVITEEVLEGLYKVKSREFFYTVKASNVTSFEKLARPLIEYLNILYHPHYKIIVTPIGAELLECAKSTGEILDYLID